ncbi:endoplasmic reticulum junction formation protein lunapark-A isoform X2 [Lepisosteus oculatus]|uniref:endoplasmic reticulum junction formation protein lunapark-A isoform X2 n=1 Tax=Lepisosteus oculatus TaxID=7918 RepID=UPI0035F51F2B
MGAVVSKWRAKPTTVEVLEGIDKEIQNLEEFREKNQRLLKLWVGRLHLYSFLLCLLTCIVVYLWYLPEEWIGRLIMALPFFAFLVLVWFMRKLLIWLFSKRTERNNEKLEELKCQKKKILEEVMEKETYKTAKLILERFDPDSKKKNELESTLAAGSPVTPRPGQELRQRNTAAQRSAAVATPVTPAARPPLAPGATPTGQLATSAPGGPPERNLPVAGQQGLARRPVSPGPPLPGMGLHPPGPPLARPILPRERSSMDRIIEYLVGDGPQNRYALICQQCFSHNGMALKEEFEYTAFRCAYCYFLNPARRTRPQAPRLPEFNIERRVRSSSPTEEVAAGAETSDTQPKPAGNREGLQKGVPSVSLATAPWSKVHSFNTNSVHHQEEEDKQEDVLADLEPQSEEMPAEPAEETESAHEPGASEVGNPTENKEEEQDLSLMETE